MAAFSAKAFCCSWSISGLTRRSKSGPGTLPVKLSCWRVWSVAVELVLVVVVLRKAERLTGPIVFMGPP
ncbi:MAG: hypothetical protein AMXMBFR33_09830 [Candidatus Xenobia bacterium]